VTTLLGAAEEADLAPAVAPAVMEAAKTKAAAAGESLKEIKAAAKQSGDASAVKPAVDALMAAKKELDELEKQVREASGVIHCGSHLHRANMSG
jgi:hypothetical protein